jgi:uncharacterized protein YukE
MGIGSWFGISEGKVSSEADGFIGVNTSAARDYVRDICGSAIKSAIRAAKDTKALFNVFEDGWKGVSLENFMSNYSKAVQALEKSLAKAFAALVKQIAAITDAMVDQDIHMVEKQ